jgi:ribosomal protein S18 acetylase RimI-like enzyme
MDVSIRPAVAGDAAAVAELYLEAARHGAELDPFVFVVPHRSVVLPKIERMIGEGSPAILVAEPDEGRILGYVIVLMDPVPGGTYRPVRYGFVDDIVVTRTERGRGIGSALIRAAETWARERGAEAMRLDTQANNVRALRFYRDHMGYRDTTVRLIRRFD